MTSVPMIVADSSLTDKVARHLVGGKAFQLGQLRDLGVNVPPFYVITSAAFHAAMRAAGLQESIQQLCDETGRARLRELMPIISHLRQAIASLVLPVDLERAIRQAHAAQFGPNERCAVRSSGQQEDDHNHSFAGIYESLVDVTGPDAVLAGLKQVWTSAVSDRALTYQGRHRIDERQVSMSVVVQRMIAADAFGVMFTCDPLDANQGTVLINACRGAGQALVNGDVVGQAYTVRKSDLRIQLAPGSAYGASDPAADEGWLSLPRETSGDHPSQILSDDQVRHAVAAGLSIERHFGAPQDIEFCFDHAGEFCVLQSRPVTHRAGQGDARGQHLVWDNSNIVESYSGVTLPMTFSFIRRAYSIVYHCFAEVMGISPRVVHEHRDAFENMLGLFHGRVYYNLRNWYRLVALFPGYSYNRQFMEAMMGVKERLDDDCPTAEPGFWRRWFVELPQLLGLCARSSWNFWRIGSTVKRFEAHFERCYQSWSRLDFQRMAPHEIMANYHAMEAAMLWKWQAPIINDFYVMVFYGVLRKLCASWCQDEAGSLQNGLLCGSGQLESAEPAKWILRLARMADQDAELRAVIVGRSADELPTYIREHPDFGEFAEEFGRFLDRYGLRCVDELKLESRTYQDEPHRVYRTIQNYLRMDHPAVWDEDAQRRSERKVCEATEQQVDEQLRAHPGWLPRRALFRHVVANARRGVRNRESMRLARTRIYGILRSMLRAIGEQFRDAGILRDTDDIFYLTLDEVWDFIKGTAVTTRLQDLVRVRRSEYARYKFDASLKPSDRFETFGVAYLGNLLSRGSEAVPRDQTGASRLRGIGCCPGVVTGSVQVVRDPIETTEFSGDILVAERTDPGWVTIYPAFAGVLVERGSVLSHSAIVAREFGIPTIVAVAGLTRELKTGQRVRMDGRTGDVEILNMDDSGPARQRTDLVPLGEV